MIHEPMHYSALERVFCATHFAIIISLEVCSCWVGIINYHPRFTDVATDVQRGQVAAQRHTADKAQGSKQVA